MVWGKTRQRPGKEQERVWSDRGRPVSSNTWKLSSDWSFLQRGFYFICWHFCWEEGLRWVMGQWLFSCCCFLLCLLTTQKALPVVYLDPAWDIGTKQSPFVKLVCSFFVFLLKGALQDSRAFLQAVYNWALRKPKQNSVSTQAKHLLCLARQS